MSYGLHLATFFHHHANWIPMGNSQHDCMFFAFDILFNIISYYYLSLLYQSHHLFPAKWSVEKWFNGIHILVSEHKILSTKNSSRDDDIKKMTFKHTACCKHWSFFPEGIHLCSLWVAKMTCLTRLALAAGEAVGIDEVEEWENRCKSDNSYL